jgi:hypothetical protein
MHGALTHGAGGREGKGGWSWHGICKRCLCNYRRIGFRYLCLVPLQVFQVGSGIVIHKFREFCIFIDYVTIRH